MTNVLNFLAYGTRFALHANDAELLAQAAAAVPLGWQAQPTSTVPHVDVEYTLLAPDAHAAAYRLVRDQTLLAQTASRAELLGHLERYAELAMAEHARTALFVHAGVVGWQGRAIVLPGRSFAGKTSLVKALVEAGASYYSDEFAVLDQAGRVHPYPRPLCLRGAEGQPATSVPVEQLGGSAGHEPLPVALIIVTRYQPGARWRPRRLSPGQALLALMDNTVAARGDPAHSMPILRQTVSLAVALHCARGEAAGTAVSIVRRLSGTYSDVQKDRSRR